MMLQKEHSVSQLAVHRMYLVSKDEMTVRIPQGWRVG